MKKYLYWPYIILTLPLYIILLLSFCILHAVCTLIEYIIVLLDRGEWWICDVHKDLRQPLNPYNVKFKHIYNNRTL